jgi:hypothetical protein
MGDRVSCVEVSSRQTPTRLAHALTSAKIEATDCRDWLADVTGKNRSRMPENVFLSIGCQAKTLFANALQHLGEWLILQNRHDCQIHEIAPHQSEFSQCLWIIAF